MQEMMELSSQQQKEQLPPRAIQIVSHPFFGRVVLTAGPAQFGTDLSKSSTGVSGFVMSQAARYQVGTKRVAHFSNVLLSNTSLTQTEGRMKSVHHIILCVSVFARVKVRGFVTVAEPYTGCAEITNAEYVRGHIALLQRGQCMFAEKARNIQKAGAIGGIVIGECVRLPTRGDSRLLDDQSRV